MATSPVVARWELARRLSSRRKELGIDVKTITDALGFTRNYWSAVENDRTLIADDKLRMLIDLLQFGEDEGEELLQLRTDARQRGWWEDYPAFDEELQRFLGLEHGAARIREYQGLLIPGLLQTPAHARCIIESDPVISPAQVDEALEIRERRQRRLLDTDLLHYSAIISEAALLQRVGNLPVHLDQLQHILSLIDRHKERVEVRILPFSRAPGFIIHSTSLSFFEFDRPHLPPIAFQEAIQSIGITEEHSPDFRRLELAWRDGLRQSLNRSDSVELIVDRMAKVADGTFNGPSVA